MGVGQRGEVEIGVTLLAVRGERSCVHRRRRCRQMGTGR
jgi:hypothetical protein